MMTKVECIEDPRLSAWIDGELAGSEAEQVGAHVAACGACRELVAEFRGSSFASADSDPSFIVRFRSARDAESGVFGWTWRQLALRLLSVAAASLVAAVVSVWAGAPTTTVDALAEVELQALGDPVAFGAAPESALEIAFSPLPGEAP